MDRDHFRHADFPLLAGTGCGKAIEPFTQQTTLRFSEVIQFRRMRLVKAGDKSS